MRFFDIFFENKGVLKVIIVVVALILISLCLAFWWVSEQFRDISVEIDPRTIPYCEQDEYVSFRNVRDERRVEMQSFLSGRDQAFYGYSTCYLIDQAWLEFERYSPENVFRVADKVIELYGDQAARMREDLQGFPDAEDQIGWGIRMYNGVAIAHFIRGRLLAQLGRPGEAKAVYEQVLSEFPYAKGYDYKNKVFVSMVDEVKKQLIVLEKESRRPIGKLTIIEGDVTCEKEELDAELCCHCD